MKLKSILENAESSFEAGGQTVVKMKKKRVFMSCPLVRFPSKFGPDIIIPKF